MKTTDRIAELKREWADATGDNPDDYGLSEDDWSVGLGDDGAAEIVSLIEQTESKDLETRYLIVTLPNTSGEEADTRASDIEAMLRRPTAFGGNGSVDHALGLVIPDRLQVVTTDDSVTLRWSQNERTVVGLSPDEARAVAGALIRAAGELG